MASENNESGCLAMQWDEDLHQLHTFEELPFDLNAHSERSLREHLLGVYNILGEWGTPRSVRLAGLFHSVYGTSSYLPTDVGLLDKQFLVDSIGADAEELVDIYCSIDRSKLLTLAAITSSALELLPHKTRDRAPVRVSRAQFGALLDLLYADRLEQMNHRDVIPLEDWARLHLTKEALVFWHRARRFLSTVASQHIDSLFNPPL